MYAEWSCLPLSVNVSISNLGVLGGIVRFCPNSSITLSRQTVETLIRRRVCGVWSGSALFTRRLGLYGLKEIKHRLTDDV